MDASAVPDAPSPQPGGSWLPRQSAPELPSGDAFSSAPPSPVQKALDQLNTSIEQALHLDAASLAAGQTPWREGDSLSSDQQTALKNAAEQFLENVPVGALAPAVVRSIEDALEAEGLEVDGLAGERIGDLGAVGKKVAKSLAMKLKDDSPAAFYGLGAAAAGIIGFEAWSGGSRRLDQLGLKPELEKGFFNDALTAKLRLDWDPHFKNVAAEGAVDASVQLTDHWKLSGETAFTTRGGFESASLTAEYSRGDVLDLTATASFAKGGLQSTGANLTYNPNERFSLSAGVTRQLRPTEQTTANLEADWKIRDNVSFSLSGAYDSRGDKRVGVGLTWKF